MLNMDPGLISKAGETGTGSPFAMQKSLYDMQNAFQQQQAQQQLGAGGFNQDETLSYLARFDPAAAMKASSQSRVASAQEAKYGASAALDEQKAKLEELKQSQAQVDVISKVASGITDQASYTSGLDYLRKQGVDVTDLPATYDAKLVKSKADMALTAKDKLSLQIQQMSAESSAAYREGLLQQGAQRINNDSGLRQAQMDLTADTSLARLNEAERHNRAIEAKASAAGKSTAKRVIERDGSIYIVDPDAATATVATGPDGKAYKTPEQRKNLQRNKQIAATLSEARDLLKRGKATSGGLQSTLADVARGVNYTTDGMKDAAKLKNIGAWLTSNTPRMEGPQSDRDVKLYSEMAGMVGDESRTMEERRAAFTSLVGIIKKYREVNK